MAYLYRFDVNLGKKDVVAIISAENDEAAFLHLEVELEKVYLRLPDVQEITLREKKRLTKRAGYILDEDEKGW